MSEAKRRRTAHETLDGGPPSDDQIVLELEIFSPGPEVLFGDDRLRLAVIRKLFARAHRRPTPICGACDYEFAFGECPPLVYCTRPTFPKADNYSFIAGSICPSCASLPTETLMQALAGHLKTVKPDLHLIQSGQA